MKFAVESDERCRPAQHSDAGRLNSASSALEPGTGRLLARGSETAARSTRLRVLAGAQRRQDQPGPADSSSRVDNAEVGAFCCCVDAAPSVAVGL